MADGYFIIHKQILDHWLWADKPFSRGQAWIDLLMMANYMPGKVMSKGTLVHVERGQVFRTIKFFCDRWGWSAKKVRNYFQTLKNDKMVTLEGLHGGTLVTIENYAKYNTLGQETGTDKGKTEGKQRATEGTHNNKNNKEIIKSNKKRDTFTPPSVDEVAAYCEKRKNDVDPQRFVDFYQMKNWMVGKNKMSDWKAAVRTWEKQRNDSDPPQRKPRPSRTQEEMAAEVAAINGMTLEEWQRINGHAE